MPKPDDVGVGVALMVLNHEGKILLHKRKGAHQAGTWCCPGGWMDREDQTSSKTCAREAAEEAGIRVYQADPLFWTTEDHPDLGVRSVTLYHVARDRMWSGVPRVMEPEKNDGWEWFDLNNLPSPLFPGLEDAVNRFQETSANWISPMPEYNPTPDLAIIMGDSLTGDRQNALSRLLTALATTPADGRPFLMSPGEIRSAIVRSEGGREILDYEHPLLDDPAVSCASKKQLLQNLKHRFNFCPDCEGMDRCPSHCTSCRMSPDCPTHG